MLFLLRRFRAVVQAAIPGTFILTSGGQAQEVLRPVISEDVSPFEAIAPVAEDGHVGLGFLRKPPGDGPFPAVVFIHGGLLEHPPGSLLTHIRGAAVSRFLEAGYVVSSITYRSRENPNAATRLSLADALAAVALVQDLPYVDGESVVINGCSGGGDLALRMAGTADFPLVIIEEPASILMTDLVTMDLLDRYFGGEAVDAVRMFRDAGGSELFVEQIAEIRNPVLLITGDLENANNEFNSEILIPELQSAGKDLTVLAYPGGHCFAFMGTIPSAQDAFLGSDEHVRARVETQPRPIDSSLVTYKPAIEPLERTPIAVAPEVLADYVGQYQLPMGFLGLPPGVRPTILVSLEDSQIQVEIPQGRAGKIPLRAESESLFFSRNGTTLEFVRGDDGSVTGGFFDGNLWVPRR